MQVDWIALALVCSALGCSDNSSSAASAGGSGGAADGSAGANTGGASASGGSTSGGSGGNAGNAASGSGAVGGSGGSPPGDAGADGPDPCKAKDPTDLCAVCLEQKCCAENKACGVGTACLTQNATGMSEFDCAFLCVLQTGVSSIKACYAKCSANGGPVTAITEAIVDCYYLTCGATCPP